MSKVCLKMLSCCLAVGICAAPLWAADRGVPVKEPQLLVKLATALEASKIGGLVSSGPDESGITYHLTSLDYLGSVTRDGQTYYFAKAFFIRSSPPGSETPPARGHTFAVILDGDFKVLSHSRNVEEISIDGDSLVYGEERESLVNPDYFIRYRGYAMGELAYPFADKITEEQWAGGTFFKPGEKP